jgi:Na+/proline symporter
MQIIANGTVRIPNHLPMHWIDWLVLTTFFIYTLWDGLRHQARTENLEDLMLARRNVSWWAAGLSVMATQASAITFIGTTGQAYMEDMRFLQVYLGLPLAMIILSGTLVPFFYRTRAYTAYELLERRFGLNVRLATSFLFLLSRAASLGITIAAPAYVLALILAVPLDWTIVIIGATATVYTMFGGISGVIRTDMKQMVLMLAGLVFCFFWIGHEMPEEVSFGDSLALAGAAGKLRTIDFDFDPSEKYNFWSGLLAGLFLMLSYFGADHSQVQRYLTARSLTDARGSLLLSAIVKIPIQFFILLLGAYLYVFYVFADRPLLFVPDTDRSAMQEQIITGDADFERLQAERKAAALALLSNPTDAEQRQRFQRLDRSVAHLREAEIVRLEAASDDSRNDTNYVLPYFVLTRLPIGVVGLIVAAILAAALSSIDSMLNSLAASSVIDWYQRLQNHRRSEGHYLYAARLATALWGILATLSALVFGETDSIIELVNEVGSYFYGPILGVFLLLWVPKATGRSALIGLSVGLAVVFLAGSFYHAETGTAVFLRMPFGGEIGELRPVLSYLWLNPIGVAATVLVGAMGRGGSA